MRFLLILGILVVSSSATADRPDWAHYRYFKQERPLTVDRGRMAIFDRNRSGPERIEEVLRSAGYDDPVVQAHAMDRWSLFMMPNASSAPQIGGIGGSRPDPIEALIQRLVTLDSSSGLFFAPVFQGSLGSIIPTPTILVRFRDEVMPSQMAEVLTTAGLGESAQHPWPGAPGFYKVEPTTRSGISVLRQANQLALRDEVVLAEVNMIFRGRSAAYFPNDPGFSASWALHNTGQSNGTPDIDLDAPEAWAKTQGSSDVFTVIIDTGVQQDHPDLHQLPGADFTDELGQNSDGGPVNFCDNHGTPVAGVVGSRINNGLGTAGVAPRAWILSARTFKSITESGSCQEGWDSETAWTIDALNWAESIGAQVTNNSNGYNFPSSAIELRYEETRAAGIVHFASAGNDAKNEIWFPAVLSSVNAVAAIRRTGIRATFSNYGPEVAFTGPGQDIFSTDRTGSAGWVAGSYASDFSGTSFSSPMLAGVAALLFSYSPWLDADHVEALLRECSVDLAPAGRDNLHGWGLPKAACALEALDGFSDNFESGNLSRWSSSSP